MTDYILRTIDLKKDFSGIKAVDGVNLNVSRGKIHAIIGPNGAGKTTLFNLLTKFVIPSGGRIELEGKDITYAGPSQIAALGMIRSFQISSVFNRLTALQNVRVALMRKGGESMHFWRPNSSMDKYNAQALSLLKQVGLGAWSDHQSGLLPYGRKRQLEIATTLALEPNILLLDEPMAGVAQEDIGPLVALVKSLAGERTIVIVEHNLKVVASLADRITVMAQGKAIAEGAYEAVSNNAEVRAAYLGSSDDM